MQNVYWRASIPIATLVLAGCLVGTPELQVWITNQTDVLLEGTLYVSYQLDSGSPHIESRTNFAVAPHGAENVVRVALLPDDGGRLSISVELANGTMFGETWPKWSAHMLDIFVGETVRYDMGWR